MMERTPDFEDDKIRFWQQRPGSEQTGEFKDDPTVMSIETEKEELFESRVYRLRLTPDTLPLSLLMVYAERVASQVEFDPKEAIDAALESMADASFKFLAKRRKENGRITYHLLFQSRGLRRLLTSRDWVTEEDYKEAVGGFEQYLVEWGLVSEPLVVTAEEWRRYMKESPPRGNEGK